MNNTLPDDIEQLKALLIAQQAVIVRLSGEITSRRLLKSGLNLSFL
ncbi:hypothetical protein ABT802_004227 [Escherichia coli]